MFREVDEVLVVFVPACAGDEVLVVFDDVRQSRIEFSGVRGTFGNVRRCTSMYFNVLQCSPLSGRSLVNTIKSTHDVRELNLFSSDPKSTAKFGSV